MANKKEKEGTKVNKNAKVILTIELGLNILAQDLIFDKHTEKNIEDYINHFKITEEDYE